MKPLLSTLRHLAAILMLPFIVTIVVPFLLVRGQSSELWSGLGYPLSLLLQLIGVALFISGLVLVIVTVRLFVTVGKGTLAPWDPTQRLVVVGIYRHVRNPMISGVIAILLGEALFLRSMAVLLWALFVILINLIYIPLLEEPGLQERFGASYADYAANVPRWLPRRTPWTPPQ
jgi:protein-S-isoprenylcysteine O-methyltransferase Ste14